MNSRIILVLLAAVAADLVHGNNYYIYDKGHKGECKVTTYIPGGSKASIEKIEAPVAKLETDVMAKLLGPLGKTSALAMHSVNLAKTFGKLASITSKLGPALGVFGAAMGILDAVAKPTMGDLLKEVNNAIDKLTHEVNDRLDKMKGYVDEKIINLEKELMTRDYKHMFQMFALCVHEGNDRAERRCMRNADKYQSSAYVKFATVDMPKGKILDVNSVKKLEVNLLTFRDYVIMRILTMRTLIDTYKDVLTEEGQTYFQDYCNQIKTDIAMYIDYVNKAYFQIKIGHTKTDICKKTVSCMPLSAIKEGFLVSVHTADKTTCKCKFDEFMAACDQTIQIRADGKHTGTKYSLHTKGGNKEVVKVLTPTLLAKAEKTYRHEMGGLIQKYWTANLLNLIRKWKAIEDATYFVKQEIVKETNPLEVRVTALEKAVKDLKEEVEGKKPKID